MIATIEIILDGLENIGFGPQRMADVMEGSVLFGPTGLLNSLELVQFVAALCDRLNIDAFELMGRFDITSSNEFHDIMTLSALLSGHIAASAGS